MKMEQGKYSETLAYKIHTSGNYPEESIQLISTFPRIIWNNAKNYDIDKIIKSLNTQLRMMKSP